MFKNKTRTPECVDSCAGFDVCVSSSLFPGSVVDDWRDKNQRGFRERLFSLTTLWFLTVKLSRLLS